MKTILTLATTMMTFLSAYAREFSYIFDNEPVAEALLQIIRDHPDLNVSLIYDELDKYRISATISTDDAYEAIKLAIGRNPVRLIEKGDNYYVEAFQHGNFNYFGQAVDINDEPVTAATVMLFDPEDSLFITYGITDDSGRFLIPCDHTDVIVKPTCLGYKPVEIRPGSFDIGIIRMEDLPFNLRTVTVIADRVVRRKDGLTITPRKKDLEFASSAYEVLYNIMIPGVSVDPATGSVTRLGTDVTLYIDGRRADYNDVESLPPGSIKKIEFIDVPSGRYIRDDTAINIITNRNDGSYLSADALQNIEYQKGKYAVKTQLTSGPTTYALSAMAEQADYNDGKGGMSELYNIGDISFIRNESAVKAPVRYDNEFFRFRVTDTREKRNLSAALTFNRQNTPESCFRDKIAYHRDGVLTESESNSTVSDKTLSPSFDLSGDFNLPHNSHLTVSANGSYSRNRYRTTYEESTFSSLQDVKEDYWTLLAETNYTRPLGKGSASIEAVEYYMKSDAVYSGTYPSVQNMSTNEIIGFAGYTVPFTDRWLLNARAGLSWIEYRLKGQDVTSHATSRCNLTLRFTPARKHALTLFLNVGNSYPTASTLNSATQVVNEYLIKRGNPSYTPALLINTGLMYNFLSRHFNMQLMYINNVFTHMLLPRYYVEEDRIIQTFNNKPTLYQNTGVLFATLDVGDGLSLKTELAVTDTRLTHTESTSHHTAFRAALDATYTYKRLMVTARFIAKEKQLGMNGIMIESFNSWKLSVRYSLTNWLFEIGARNLFRHDNLIHNSFQSYVYSYRSGIYDRTSQSNVYAKVTFRINRGKKQKVTGMDADTNPSSAILK